MSKDGGTRPREVLVALVGAWGPGHLPTFGGRLAGKCRKSDYIFLAA